MIPINPQSGERQGYVVPAASPCTADAGKWYAYRLEAADNGREPAWRYAGAYATEQEAATAAGIA